MNGKAVRDRTFQTFLSHAHADKSVVDQLVSWLTDIAGIRVWYDSRNLPPSSTIVQFLPQAISDSRSMVLALSKTSITKGWVEEEYNAAINQRTQFRDFRIIPLRIDDCEVPGFLQTTKWIDLPDGKFSLAIATELLSALYYENSDFELDDALDIFISRSWRASDAKMTDSICQALTLAGFRLIADSEDQRDYDPQRVAGIISSCGGLAAILPDRGQGTTSKYMLKEIEIARRMELPILIVAEETVVLPDGLDEITVKIPRESLENNGTNTQLVNQIEKLFEEWQKPNRPHYIFIATDFDAEHRTRNESFQRILKRITSMTCEIGEYIRESQIQKVISDLIANAYLLIADMSNDNINTLIEAGIARGAGVPFHLVASGPRQRPPFMFRDQQVWYYGDDVELLGNIHRIAYPYRRRVVNYELPK